MSRVQVGGLTVGLRFKRRVSTAPYAQGFPRPFERCHPLPLAAQTEQKRSSVQVALAKIAMIPHVAYCRGSSQGVCWRKPIDFPRSIMWNIKRLQICLIPQK